MNPEQALQNLDIATQPGVKLTRQDYINVQVSLETLRSFVEANTPKPADNKE